MSLQESPQESAAASQDPIENLATMTSDNDESCSHSIEEISEASKRHPSKGDDHREPFEEQFLAFKKRFDDQMELEAKLQLAIDFMEASLTQEGIPHFRSFWEARRLCIPLFKENVSPLLRNHLWNKYSDLSKEARRLKDMLDEQSAFAVEQFEIAIQALEKELLDFETNLDKPIQLICPHVLKQQQSFYELVQKQLNFLNVQASRINALRKELLKTDMRVRLKNKFFQALSLAGDKVFPKRKDLIAQISQQFEQDVERFIKTHFGDHPSHESLHVLREDIKALQGFAKALTLNTHSFSQTRAQLSECWDRLKIEEKERKKERTQQQAVFKQNAEELRQKISTLKEGVEKQEESSNASQKKMEEILGQMRSVELGRDELKALREEINTVRKLLQDRSKVEEDARLRLEDEKIRQKKEKFLSLKANVEILLRQDDAVDPDQLAADRDALIAQIHDAPLSKNEKQELERLLKPLRDIILEMQDKRLLELSDDDRQALQQLQAVLLQRKERRQEIKNQLEILRKGAGSSSLDFEKAMHFTTQINEEKERLEKANQGIAEIEQKIAELQTKIRKKQNH